MKNKRILIIFFIALVLFLPVPQVSYDDGGTREFSAMTYKIVKWNRLLPKKGNVERIDIYSKTSIYWFPDNFKSIDELWELEYQSK